MNIIRVILQQSSSANGKKTQQQLCIKKIIAINHLHVILDALIKDVNVVSCRFQLLLKRLCSTALPLSLLSGEVKLKEQVSLVALSLSYLHRCYSFHFVAYSPNFAFSLSITLKSYRHYLHSMLPWKALHSHYFLCSIRFYYITIEWYYIRRFLLWCS